MLKPNRVFILSVFALQVLGLLAGCLDDGPETDPGSSSAPTDSSTPSPSPHLGIDLPPATELHMLGMDCVGAYVEWYWPDADPLQVPTPPGWEPGPRPLDGARLFPFDCRHVSWGPYERPVRFLIEAHSRLAPPETCREGGGNVGEANFYAYLNRFITSDADVAAYLTRRFNITTSVGDVNHTREVMGAVDHWNWTWNVEGNESSMEWVGNSDGFESPLPEIARLFWMNGEGISFMDFKNGREDSQASNNSVTGYATPPMLIAQKTRHFAAVDGDGFFNVSLDGQIQEYGNYDCDPS